MANFSKILLLAFLLLSIVSISEARESIHIVEKSSASYHRLASNCNDATSQIDLDINNVRVRLLGAGDFWWDLNNAIYEIPKVDPTTGDVPVSSLFAGALWIGGFDNGGQLKLAAQTYRQSGNDFWPGPLDNDGSISRDVCSAYDKHWKIERQDIEDFLEVLALGTPVPVGAIPASILEWPAKGNPYARGKNDVALTVDRNLAPFIDNDETLDGLYDPTTGDYPDIDGDQAIFWVYNDRGNIHTNTNGEEIGLEIQAMAFGFQTADEVNDMSFYRYSVLNFSPSALDSTYFGMWVDADLGAFNDDFVGCDTTLGLGICYNGQAVDGPASPNYGETPPIVGTDFFQGPKKYFYDDEGDLDSVLLGMTSFLYYNNDFSITGEPTTSNHFYGYMSGTWKDGSPFTAGGNGYGGSIKSRYMFPDPPSAPAPAWSECSENNTPFDRRYLQSSGPFRLDPGAKNEVVVGVVWVPQSSQTACAANFDLLKSADEKAQALFDSDFKLLDGPDAPDMAVRELSQEIVISLGNGPNSNNLGENYEEADPIIKKIVENDQTGEITDSTYNFQGYILYQLRDSKISTSEYDDPDKARIVAQVDIKDGVSKIVNFNFDKDINAEVPVLKVDGNDAGIAHAFQILEDAFAAGDKKLVNHKTYYFSVVAYAHNSYAAYDASDPNTQRKPYLEGRKNIKVYTAIPHLPAPENNGMVLNAAFGDGPELQRMDGSGNGGQALDFIASTEAAILKDGYAAQPIYQARKAPVDVMVVDPLKIPAADFEIALEDPSFDGTDSILNSTTAVWTITNLSTGEQVASDRSLDAINEQLIAKWGLAISVKQVANPGGELVLIFDTVPYYQQEENNGVLEASLSYEDPTQAWLTGVEDGEAQSRVNWIRSGNFTDNFGCFGDDSLPASFDGSIFYSEDLDQHYESILEGTWAPYTLVAHSGQGTAPCSGFPVSSQLKVSKKLSNISATPSIDLVFSPNPDDWTRSAVVTTGDDEDLDSYGDSKGRLRSAPSVDKAGIEDGSGAGMSWFPGYAINVETGERLNIFFGENPFLANHNGNDMRWNPSSTLFDAFFNPVFGGMHFVYVHNSRYDEGLAIANALHGDQPAISAMRAYAEVAWVGTPMLLAGAAFTALDDGFIPTKTRLRFRVSKPFIHEAITGENNGLPLYRFSTHGLAPTLGSTAVAEEALALVNVVPNPYYAHSAYETTQLDNRIKLTNLPPRCTVSIFSLDGALVRRFDRDVAADNSSGGVLGTSSKNLDTSLDWDLKNHKGIPIAGGVYLIHVDAGELGERTLKWFGVVRPVDLDTF